MLGGRFQIPSLQTNMSPENRRLVHMNFPFGAEGLFSEVNSLLLFTEGMFLKFLYVDLPEEMIQS